MERSGNATPSALLQSWAGLAAKRVCWRTEWLAVAPKAGSQREPKVGGEAEFVHELYFCSRGCSFLFRLQAMQ